MFVYYFLNLLSSLIILISVLSLALTFWVIDQLDITSEYVSALSPATLSSVILKGPREAVLIPPAAKLTVLLILAPEITTLCCGPGPIH